MRKNAADYQCHSIYELDLVKLADMGFTYLFIDLDNTLAAYDCYNPEMRTYQLIDKIHRAGLEVIIISNNTYNRTVPYAAKLGLEAIYSAFKPFGNKLRKYLYRHSIPLHKALLIGDQVMNDMLLAHHSGLKGLLTDPLTGKDHITARLVRPLDKKLRQKYLREGSLGVDLDDQKKEEI